MQILKFDTIHEAHLDLGAHTLEIKAQGHNETDLYVMEDGDWKNVTTYLTDKIGEFDIDRVLVWVESYKNVIAWGGIPIYTEDTSKLPDGMYLGLFHGRDNPMQDMDEWGYNGPMIGPLAFAHTTYNCNVKIRFSRNGPPDRNLLYDMDEEAMLDIVDDTIMFQGKYYGDWTVFCVKGGEPQQ